MRSLWQKVKELEGKTLHTLARHKPFEIVMVTETDCFVKVGSTGKIRPIPKTNFENALKIGPISSLNTTILRRRGASEVNPAYVLAILTEIDA